MGEAGRPAIALPVSIAESGQAWGHSNAMEAIIASI